LGLLTSAASAQSTAPWRSSYFPYPIANPADGAMVVARWERIQNAPYFRSKSDAADVINPITFAGALSIEAGIGTLGSRFGRVEFRGPGLVDGWRFRVIGSAERRGRFGYYGLGGDIAQAESAADPNANDFRVHRVRYLLQGDVTHTIKGPLRLALGWSLDRTEFTRLPGETLFNSEYPGGYRKTGFLLRPALVFDTRDREATPSQGVLVEAGGGFGTGRESNSAADTKSLYAFGYAHLRGWISPREGTVLAARVLVRKMETAAPLAARYTVPGWERETGWSGAEGHRSFPDGALAGTDVELVSAEVRHDLINVGDLGAVTLVGFFDYAHLTDNRASFQFDASQYGGGGGVAVRVLRSAVLTMNFAGGKNGLNFSMGTTWTF
jgi:outer membrane protein assembly factor BamA